MGETSSNSGNANNIKNGSLRSLKSSQMGLSEENREVHLGAMYVYSKQINETKIVGEEVTRNIDKDNILNVISSLKAIGKQRCFNNLELNDNCKEWVTDILYDVSQDLDVKLKYLLNDFTNSMMTRMREKNKYVISIVSDGSLLVCHSRGREDTITPGWKVVRRMLDKDNVDRFVFFIKEKDSIDVYYYEHYPSESFVTWLGIPERDAFYDLGGKNRIYADIDGMHCSLELSDDEIQDLFISQTAHPAASSGACSRRSSAI